MSKSPEVPLHARINVYVGGQEGQTMLDELDFLAKYYGEQSRSAVIRLLVRKDYRNVEELEYARN
jgi:hypothetical protein